MFCHRYIQQEEGLYHIAVTTGDRPGAGTDADDVTINIIGEHGQTGPVLLDNEQNNFGASWFLDKVIIKSDAQPWRSNLQSVYNEVFKDVIWRAFRLTGKNVRLIQRCNTKNNTLKLFSNFVN